MWSFIGNKQNKQWIWLALDRETKEIVGVHVGERSRAGAKGLWQSLPALYRQCAVSYTDFWSAYEQIFPQSRHIAANKTSGKTRRRSKVRATKCSLELKPLYSNSYSASTKEQSQGAER